MNKKELVQSISEKADISIIEAEKCLCAFTHSIENTLARGDKVTLVGFGTFEPKKRNARDGRNPKTGGTVYIPSSIVPCFKAGKNLKEMVNK